MVWKQFKKWVETLQLQVVRVSYKQLPGKILHTVAADKE